MEMPNKESKQSEAMTSGSAPNKDITNNNSNNFGKSPDMGLMKAVKKIPAKSRKNKSVTPNNSKKVSATSSRQEKGTAQAQKPSVNLARPSGSAKTQPTVTHSSGLTGTDTIHITLDNSHTIQSTSTPQIFIATSYNSETLAPPSITNFFGNTNGSMSIHDDGTTKFSQEKPKTSNSRPKNMGASMDVDNGSTISQQHA